MSLDFTKLVAQGRAKAQGQPWQPEELDALVKLEQERGLSRIKAADFIRNGVLTLEAYDEAIKADFTPVSLQEAEAKTMADLKERGKEFGATITEETPVVKAKRKAKKTND